MRITALSGYTHREIEITDISEKLKTCNIVKKISVYENRRKYYADTLCEDSTELQNKNNFLTLSEIF